MCGFYARIYLMGHRLPPRRRRSGFDWKAQAFAQEEADRRREAEARAQQAEAELEQLRAQLAALEDERS